MKGPLGAYARSAWEFAWAVTGRADAAVACLARLVKRLEVERLPAEEPARRRAFLRALVDACRLQAGTSPPGPPESSDPRLAQILALPIEMRAALLLLRFHGASGEDLGAALGTPPDYALDQAQRALSRIALGRAMPSP